AGPSWRGASFGGGPACLARRPTSRCEQRRQEERLSRRGTALPRQPSVGRGAAAAGGEYRLGGGRLAHCVQAILQFDERNLQGLARYLTLVASRPRLGEALLPGFVALLEFRRVKLQALDQRPARQDPVEEGRALLQEFEDNRRIGHGHILQKMAEGYYQARALRTSRPGTRREVVGGRGASSPGPLARSLRAHHRSL